MDPSVQGNLKPRPGIRPLHTTIPLGTLSPQRGAPRPDIADLGGSTLVARALWAALAALALVGVEETNEVSVRLHGLGHAMPEGGVERGGFGPVGMVAVDGAGRVLELEGRAGGVEVGEG